MVCQAAKICRHTITPYENFPLPKKRFQTVHVDLVGPLPPSRGYSYILTCINPFTRWAEAMPIHDITAETTAWGFMNTCVAKFGAPDTIITDRGAQFESDLWRRLLQVLGTIHQRTTAYHPQSNGMVERFHHFKDGLKCQPHSYRWADSLPIVLLSIRTSVKEDLQSSPAELTYGEPLRLPGEFISPQENDSAEATRYEFQHALRRTIADLVSTPHRQQRAQRTYIPKDLVQAEFVFIRHGARCGLARPYEGPYRVLARTPKHFRRYFFGPLEACFGTCFHQA